MLVFSTGLGSAALQDIYIAQFGELMERTSGGFRLVDYFIRLHGEEQEI